MKADKKEIILNAAEKLIASATNTDFSMSMIAKEAGIAKGGIYYYFNSKEDVLQAVLKRAYGRAVLEYNNTDKDGKNAVEKIRILFLCIIKKEFSDGELNLLYSLNTNDSILFHNYIKLIAIEEISPVLEQILADGKKEGIILSNTEILPREIAEMIVAVLAFLLDGTIFKNEQSDEKIKLFSRVLDTCLAAEPGTFGFISDSRE